MEEANFTNFGENGSKDEGIKDVEREDMGQEHCNLQRILDNAIVKTEIKMEDDIYESASENDSIDKGGNRTAGIERNEEEPCNLQGVLDNGIAKTEIKMEDDDVDDDIPDSSTDNGTKDEEGSIFSVGIERNGHLEDVLDDTIVKSEIKMEEDDIIDCPTESTLNDEVNKDVQTETDPGETEVQMKKANDKNNIRMEHCVFSDSAIQFLQKLKSRLLSNEIVPGHAGRKHNARTDEMPTEIETTKNGWTKLNTVLFKDGILINNTDFLHSFTQSALVQESEQPNMLNEKNNTVGTGKNVQETFESSEIETYNIVVMQEKITIDDTCFGNSVIQSGLNNNAETNENSFNKERRLESSEVTENELNNTICKAIDTTKDAHLQVSAHPIHFNNISETYEAITRPKNGQEPFQDPQVEADHVVVKKETVKVGNIGNNGQEHCQGPGIETDIKIMMRCSVNLERLRSIEKYCQEPFEYSIGVLPILGRQQSGLIQVQTNDMSAQMNGQGLIINSEADITTEEINDILFINLGVLNNKPEPVDAAMDGQDPLTCIETYDDILSSSETRDARLVESDNKEKAWSDEEVSAEEFQDLDDECIDVDEDFSDENDQPLSVLTKHNPLKYKANKTGSGKQVSTEKDMQDQNQKIEIAHKNYKCNSCDESFTLKSKYQVHLLYHGNMKCLKCHRMFDSGFILKNHMQKNHFQELNKHLSIHVDKNVHKCSVCQKSFIGQKSLLNHKRMHQFTNSYKCIHCNKLYGNIVHLNKHLLTHDARSVESDNKGKAWSDKEVSTGEFQDMSGECIDVDEDFSDEDDQPLSVLAKHNPVEYKVKNKAGSGKQVSTELESEPVDAEMDVQDTLTCIEIYDDDILSSDVEFVDSKEAQDKVVSTEKDLHDPNQKIEIAHKNYKCNLCDITFTLKSMYQVHLLYHGNMKCLRCHRMFDSGFALQNHMQTYHNEKPLQPLSVLAKHNPLKYNVKNKAGSGKQVSTELTFQDILTENNGQNPSQDRITEFNLDLDTDKNVSESANHQQNYMCIGCGDMFTTTEELEKHEITHKKYECDLCEIVFNQYSKYQQHLVYHIDGDKLKCMHCKKSFDSGLTLKCHMQTRNCKQCRKCLRSSAALEQHMQFIHSGIHPYKCTQCDEGFLLAEELDKHSRIHSYEKVHTCPVCYKSFSKRGNLNSHFRRHGDKDYKCTKCSKAFVAQHDLDSHMLFHNGVKNHICNICSKAFMRRSALNKHLRKHTGMQPHKCPLCDKRFSYIKRVKRHLVVIHYGKKEHKCIHCNECFALFRDLEKHYRTHNDLRPRKCKECPKSFSKQHHLTTHMLSHSGVKPHQCVQCGSSFRLPHHLRNHLLTHSAKKRPKRK